MSQFVSRPRLACACSACLDAPGSPPGRSIRKQTAWGEVAFVACPACGSFAQSPEIVPTSLALWYDSAVYQGSQAGGGAGYHNYLADEDTRLIEARNRFARDLAPHLEPSSTVLEIGAATGSLLVAIREAGHQVRGIDLSERFVAYGRNRHGLDLLACDFLDMVDDGTRYDMILLLGTISNLVEPQRHLSKIVQFLKPAGTLVLNLPVADSLIARLYGERFWMFTPSVNTFFSEAGICRLLESTGFRVRELRMDRQQPSFGKLAHHARIAMFQALVRRLEIGESRLPFALPLPGIRFVRAERIASA